MNTVFGATISQMIGFFLIMLTGYVTKKTNMVAEQGDKILSQLLSRVVMPALVFQTFSKNFKPEIFAEKMTYLLWGIGVLLAALFVSWILTRFFAKDTYMKRIYFYSLAIANLGYMGYSVVSAVFGEAVLLDMMVFCTPFQVYIYAISFPILSYGDAKISLKSLCNPIFFMMILGAVCGLCRVPVPSLLTSTVANVAGCMSPIAMLITGLTVAKYNIRELISGKILIVSVLRLLLIPSLFMFLLKGIGAPAGVVTVALYALAMPTGLNTVVFPAASGADTRPGAGMALISNLFALLTIPLMFALWIG